MKKKKKQNQIRKPLPDLSFMYGFAGLKKIPFERMPKDKSISLRLSSELLDVIKEKAEEDGLDYQKWIRFAIEEALGPKAFKKEF
ncbi:MAG: CopG family antitoxin [Bacteriovoracaceae bacterium]